MYTVCSRSSDPFHIVTYYKSLSGAATGFQAGGGGARIFRNKSFSGSRDKFKDKGSKLKKEGTNLKIKDPN